MSGLPLTESGRCREIYDGEWTVYNNNGNGYVRCGVYRNSCTGQTRYVNCRNVVGYYPHILKNMDTQSAKMSGLNDRFPGGTRCATIGGQQLCCDYNVQTGQVIKCYTVKGNHTPPYQQRQSAKMGGFSFGDLFGNGGFDFSNINGGYSNNFGVPLTNPGIPVVWTDGSGVPVGATTGGQSTQQPTQGSTGTNAGGLSELDKLFALVLGTAPNIINSIRGSGNGVLTNSNGQVIATNAANQTAAGTAAQAGANAGAAAGNLTQGIFSFMSQNPLLTLAVLGGGVLLLMPSPRSRNGVLRLIPNPKRKTRRRRR